MEAVLRKPKLNVPVRVAVLLMAIRLALFFANADFPGQEQIYLFLTLAALPALAIYAIWPRGQAPDVLGDTISALRVTLVYALLMVVFFYFYFTFADRDFFPNFQDRAIGLELNADTGLSREEIADRARQFFSKGNFIAIALGAMVLMSVFYSLFFSVLKKVFLTRGKA